MPAGRAEGGRAVDGDARWRIVRPSLASARQHRRGSGSEPMHVGLAAIFQNPGQRLADRDVYEAELRLASLAEPLGYDSVWSVEHHFTDYTMCPNPAQFLAFMAGRTTRVQLGTMVMVLPWHDPLRVAEEIAVVDAMSGGRVILGIGRGAGLVEFEGFRVDMNESRERFVEAAEMILPALETGHMGYAGKHYRQPPVAIRPKPFKTFRGRTYAAAVSPESARIMARLGIGILVIPQKPWHEVEKELAEYRRIYLEVNTEPAPQPIAAGWVFVDRDATRAEEMATRYISGYYKTVLEHYKFGNDHLKTTKGYEYYGKFADKIQEKGEQEFVDYFRDLQVWGTPEMCLEKIRHVQSRIASCGFIGVFSYAGMPYDEAERNLRLFTEAVVPELKRMDVGAEPDMTGVSVRQAAE
jgi:alkanesulfonate monooxygenase SsuD/methylene tetrahydromethanopterin reductase-like flavin-dependent oxidoreductase (luciferase family)